jgi:hypothetical protein
MFFKTRVRFPPSPQNEGSHMKKGTVVFLSADDVKTPSLSKGPLDVDFHDFMAAPREAIEKADLVIYSEKNIFKIIKDRHGIGALGMNR